MERDENSNGNRLIETILGDYEVCFLEGRCCACGVDVHIRVSRDSGFENGSVFECDNKFFGKCYVCTQYSARIGKITDVYLALRCVGAIMGKDK